MADVVFRPRRGRVLPLSMGVVALLITGVVALLMRDQGWRPGDQLMLFSLGLMMFGLMWRYASIRAVATDSALVVRNLFLTRMVSWHEIESARFAHGDPWFYLDLADGDTLGVMAVQRADGEQGRAEAQHLADLIRERRRP